MNNADIIKTLKAFARANANYLARNGVKLTEEDQEILDAYYDKFGGLPADGGFTIEAARECLRTGKDFYDRFPKDVNP
jgi:hypothetical protein